MFHRAAKFLEDCTATDARIPTLDRFGFLLLLLATVVAPVPFGSILPSGRLRIEIVGFVAAAAAFASASRPFSRRAPVLPAALMAGVAILGIVQLLPLSESTIGVLSPASATIYHEASGVLRGFGRARLAPRISIASTETAGAILLILAEIAIFLSAAELLRGRARRRLFAAAVTVSAAIQIGAGVAAAEPGERIHGPFVNPDHFAGYLEIVLALAFAALWAEILRGPDRGRGAEERAERLERRLPPLAFRVLAWGFVATGIALTRSRGGIAAALAATVAMIAVALSARRRRPAGASAGIVLAVLVGLIFVAGAAWREAVARFLSSDPRDIGADMRVAIWRSSVAAWAPFRWLGSGLGSFREAFRLVQPRGTEGLVEQAHSDSLQMLVTGGIVGLALSTAAFAAIFVLLARELRSRRHREERAFALAGIGALLALVLHGAVDFNLSIPAIPATLAAVLGLAFAAADEPAPVRLRDRPPDRTATTAR